ncbi:hypothetical protein TNIN_181241 [Trichonephila inaurata madagascariensis]|uniref:Uncharacterized protein n=1 Tax=Trichonephila inaurata madagascariensis TaxID=2747483 RepID=A0A8X7CBR4_9ARAC|nr:hypothetical protein TNIN_181241 [Trichonephila inaurata madagascariensis]
MIERREPLLCLFASCLEAEVSLPSQMMPSAFSSPEDHITGAENSPPESNCYLHVSLWHCIFTPPFLYECVLSSTAIYYLWEIWGRGMNY